MGLETLIKFGYCLITITILLMLWASSLQARQIDSAQYPPCTFNPLCKCSKAAPDLGIVQCRNVPFSAIPRTVNSSKVFMLHIDNTGLRTLEPYFLQATGLYRLEISNNPLALIPDDSFVGLERTMWELILRYNELIEVPTKSLRYLQKLKVLDLSGNQISKVEPDAWRGLEDSLQVLSLSDNYLSALPSDGFSGLLVLDSLDLSGNNLQEIDGSVFRDGMNRLSKLNLADNLLMEIPYQQISPLKILKQLDMSNNRLISVLPQTPETKIDTKFNLDVLHLESNSIVLIGTASFEHFNTLNRTFLDGNPIKVIQEDAFRSAKIRELYIRHCKLDSISPLAFGGLEKSLQVLDMSGNNITEFHNKVFSDFDYLRTLNLKNNNLKNIIPQETFNGFQRTLNKLDLSGGQNAVVNLQDLRRMRNLRSLSLTKLLANQISAEDFLEFGGEVEDLKITQGALQTIKTNAFTHLRGLRRLDLSDNRLSNIDPEAFKELGHSLIALRISHGLSSDSHTFPASISKNLHSLKELDLSNNHLKSIPDTSFHFLKNIRAIDLRDNRIEQINKGTFQGDIHSKLEEVLFSFNSIKHISQHTFVDLQQLKRLHLDDNKIEKIERRGFMNLDRLQVLSLRGNKISSISDESFQNLPEVELIDLSYNSINYFDFDYLDQVGTLSSLKVDLSNNKIQQLVDNSSNFGFTKDHSFYHSNIKNLDLSNNNISEIQMNYFKPVEISLVHLNMANNRLSNTSRLTFGNLMHLQWLDLSNNVITEIEQDSFRNTKRLQYLDLSNNLIGDIPVELFKYVNNIRILDLSNNNLRSIPENLLFSEGLERVDLSFNQLTKIPVTSMTNLAALTICDLDLSNNHIGAIHSMDLSNKFRSLSKLDLSHNRLVRLEDAVFATLPHLTELDLSHNSELEISGKAFIGLENSLLDLNLDNVSITTFPDLPLPFLRKLSIAYNELPFVPPELASNLSSLRELDLSYNDLTNIPIITHSLLHLRSLSLAGNPISGLTNTSLLGAADTLIELNIANCQLNSFEAGALSKMNTLQSLTLSCYPNVSNFNIPRILDDVESLRKLAVQAYSFNPKLSSTIDDHISSHPPIHSVNVECDLRKEMDGELPSKLKILEFNGRGFKKLAENILNGVQSPVLHVILSNTSISTLPASFFSNLENVRNISIDISLNNDLLKTIPNPNTASIIHLPNKAFLVDLDVGDDNAFDCDCNLGWIEFWNRKKRQFLCSSHDWSEDEEPLHYSQAMQSQKHLCGASDHGLREASCSNKKSQPLMEVLKTELECGWGSSGNRLEKTVLLVTLSLGFLLWF